MNTHSHDTESDHGQALPAGTRLEEFFIERVLGSGGFGITYLARDTALGRQVVIKENLPVQFCFRDTYSLTVAPRHSHGEDADNFQWSLENFSKEAAMLASLHHPGIVQVLRSFQAFGTAYFVMPFVEGVTLEDLLQSRKREVQTFTEDELCGLLQRVLSSLDHLHQRGIYHRDIKPANILITNEGVPVLIDFGSARQRLSERSMTVVESAGYTPFEQLQTRGRIGPWSDLYALGATLAKVITGEGPPKATDRAFDDPWPPLAQRQEWTVRYSTALLESIDRAMAVRIEDRFQDAGEWMAALENQTTLASSLPPSRGSFSETLSSQHQLIPEQTEQKQTRQSNRKSQRYLFVAMLALLAVGAVGSVAFIGRGRGNRVAEERITIVESRVVTKTEAETPPEKIPNQVEEPPPALAPSVGTPMGVPLTTMLPPELIEGAPKPMNVPNLLPASTKPPELLVPEGTVLLSRGKPVTSSDDAPIIGNLDLITDGEKDASEGYFVELLDGMQWVQIDLEQSARISAVWLWHFHSQKRAYHDVIIQVSDDAYFKTGVTTVYNNDYDDSSKFGKGADNPYVETRFGKLVDAKGAKGRYVRLYSNGSTSNEMNHYIEVEVFGIPLPSAVSGTPRATSLRPRIRLETSEGDIILELDKEKAPVSVENFLGYVKKNHYDGTVFHRVMNGFIIQGGGFAISDGKLIEKASGKGIKNEGQNGLRNDRGTIAMARTSDPNSATAQFFINVVDNSALDYPSNGGYAVFGKVIKGMEVVDKIKAMNTGVSKLLLRHPTTGEMREMPLQDVPIQNIVIKSASIAK